MGASFLTVRHFFRANYPESIWAGSFCDLNTFFHCDASAFSTIAEVAGVPIGLFGALLGGLVVLGAVIPSRELERTNKSLALVNGAGVIGLLGYSLVGLGSVCLLCAAYYLFSLLSLFLFWQRGIDHSDVSFARRWLRFSPRILAVFAVVTAAQAYGMALYHEARRAALSGGAAARVVQQFFELPEVAWPTLVSPYWTAQATDRFEDAPIRVVEYGDFLCPDCRYLNDQLASLKEEFRGQINVAFQFFPLEASCNDVVEKDKHPGACDLSYMAAHDPDRFLAIHDEVFANLEAARDPVWREALARRHGVEAATADSATIGRVHALIRTGAEYARTSEEYAHGIRSTPTMIINNRMVIGTFPYEQLRAIFQALVDEHGPRESYLENWVE